MAQRPTDPLGQEKPGRDPDSIPGCESRPLEPRRQSQPRPLVHVRPGALVVHSDMGPDDLH